MNQNLGVVYVSAFPRYVEVSLRPIVSSQIPLYTWRGHWENFLDMNAFKNRHVVAVASECILTLLSNDDCSMVTIQY